MKRAGFFPGLVLAMNGLSSSDGKALSSDHAVRIKEGNDDKKFGTKPGINFDLADDNVDFSEEKRVDGLLSGHEIAAGEESYLKLIMEMQTMPLSKMKQIRPKGNNSVVASGERGFIGPLSEDSRNLMIAQAAYFRALARGFEDGHADEDWYAAESEIQQIQDH